MIWWWTVHPFSHLISIESLLCAAHHLVSWIQEEVKKDSDSWLEHYGRRCSSIPSGGLKREGQCETENLLLIGFAGVACPREEY